MYTVTEVAKMLGCNRETIARMLRDGRIKGIKISRDWRIPQSEIDKILKGE